MSPATFPVSVGNNANSGASQAMKAYQNKPQMKLLNVWSKTYVRSQQLFVIFFFFWTWIVDEIVGNGGDLDTGYFPKKTKPAKPSTETVFEICASMRKLSIIILQTIYFVSCFFKYFNYASACIINLNRVNAKSQIFWNFECF